MPCDVPENPLGFQNRHNFVELCLATIVSPAAVGESRILGACHGDSVNPMARSKSSNPQPDDASKDVKRRRASSVRARNIRDERAHESRGECPAVSSRERIARPAAQFDADALRCETGKIR